MTAPTVRKARPNELPQLAKVLARAFQDDPVMAWLFPDDRARARKLPAFFSALARISVMPHDHVYTTDAYEGAALSNPPGTWRTDWRGQLRLVPRSVQLIGPRIVSRGRSFTYIERHHPTEPHWYLTMIGTEPDLQGRGIGSALLQPILECSEADGLPVYLESSKESNIPFYARHGFELCGEIRVPKGPTMWPMLRRP